MSANPKTDRELLESIHAMLSRMEELHVDLLVKKPTQKELARRLGVHPVTISRRRQRKQIARLLEGVV